MLTGTFPVPGHRYHLVGRGRQGRDRRDVDKRRDGLIVLTLRRFCVCVPALAPIELARVVGDQFLKRVVGLGFEISDDLK